MNTVISAYKAIVDDEIVALSGCDNETCELSCLRKDTQLSCRADQNVKNYKDCNYHIPVHQL